MDRAIARPGDPDGSGLRGYGALCQWRPRLPKGRSDVQTEDILGDGHSAEKIVEVLMECTRC